MTMNLLEKAQLIVQASLHDLLDKQVNTTKGYKQHIRKLQEALAATWAGVDEAQGELNGRKRQKVQLILDRDENIAAADELFGDGDPSNDEQAVEFQMRSDAAAAKLEGMDEQIADLTATRDQLKAAAKQMEAKVVEMSDNLQRLTMAEAAAKAKNRAASAVEAAQAASSDASVADFGSIEAEIQREKDIADARFDRVLGGTTSGTVTADEALRRSRAVAALKARNAKIAETATSAGGSATS